MKINATQRLLSSTPKHTQRETKFAALVTKAFDSAGIEYEPVVNAGEPSFSLDPKESAKKVLDVLTKATKVKPVKNAHLGAQVFNTEDVAIIVYLKNAKLNRVVVSDQDDD